MRTAAEGSGDEHVHQRLSAAQVPASLFSASPSAPMRSEIPSVARAGASPAAASIRYPSGVSWTLDLLTRAQRALADRHDTGPAREVP